MPRDKGDQIEDLLAAFKKSQGSRGSVPALGELTEAIFREFGGVDVFAKEMISSYRKASDPKTGNKAVAAKILDLVTLLTKEYSRQNKGTERPPLEYLTTEDLKSYARNLLVNIVKGDESFRAELLALAKEPTVGTAQETRSPQGDQGGEAGDT